MFLLYFYYIIIILLLYFYCIFIIFLLYFYYIFIILLLYFYYIFIIFLLNFYYIFITFFASSLFAKFTKANWLITNGYFISGVILGVLTSQLVTGPNVENAVSNYTFVTEVFKFFKNRLVSFYT